MAYYWKDEIKVKISNMAIDRRSIIKSNDIPRSLLCSQFYLANPSHWTGLLPANGEIFCDDDVYAEIIGETAIKIELKMLNITRVLVYPILIAKSLTCTLMFGRDLINESKLTIPTCCEEIGMFQTPPVRVDSNRPNIHFLIKEPFDTNKIELKSTYLSCEPYFANASRVNIVERWVNGCGNSHNNGVDEIHVESNVVRCHDDEKNQLKDKTLVHVQYTW